MLVLALAGLVGTADRVWWMVCSALILFAGLPHGAYDLVIMQASRRGVGLLAMVAGYVAVAALVLALWVMSPQILLVSFLVYSAYHFGDSDFAHTRWLHKVSWGAAIIGLPALMSGQSVAVLFSLITQTQDTGLIVDGLAVVGAVAALLQISSSRQRWFIAVVLSMYALTCWMAGALVAFTCYFVFLHSPLHLTHWRRELQLNGAGVVYGLSLIVIATIGAALWLAVSDRPDLMNALNETAVRYTFIALAALTVPHMVLMSFARNNLTSKVEKRIAA
jgi:Brp/Blh family beta-carotene 15,15'-monooxygenase